MAELSNADWFARATSVIPGGVNSPVRAFGSVGGTPYFVQSAAGATVTDVEGTTYIDYVQSYGASILGHAAPVALTAIADAAVRGTTYGAPTPGEVELAELLCARVPGLEQVRMVSSGTEATMSAIRLARGATGRSTLVKFAGHYHGHSDALLVAGGSGVATQGLADSAGVTPGAVADTVVVPWNVVPDLTDAAVLIVEPVAANMGLVPPGEGFLAELRAECDRTGTLLMFDEVITGSRLGAGGASEWYSVQPDLWSFGKVIGGGLPVGAFGGRRELMDHMAPIGEVYQAGTLSGNPLAMAAGAAVLDELTPDAYAELSGTAARLAEGVAEACAAAGIDVVVPRVGPLLSLFFGSEMPVDFDGARRSVDGGRYTEFFAGMLRRGISLAPGPYEVWFPSLAHTPAHIDQTVAAVGEVAAELAKGS